MQGGYVPGYYMQPGFQAPQPALPTQQSLAGYLASYQGWGMLVVTGTIHQLASDQGWGCWMVLSTLHLIAKPNSGLQMVPHPGNPASSWPGSEPARSDVQESDDEDSTSSYWAAL